MIDWFRATINDFWSANIIKQLKLLIFFESHHDNKNFQIAWGIFLWNLYYHHNLMISLNFQIFLHTCLSFSQYFRRRKIVKGKMLKYFWTNQSVLGTLGSIQFNVTYKQDQKQIVVHLIRAKVVDVFLIWLLTRFRIFVLWIKMVSRTHMWSFIWFLEMQKPLN